MENLENLRTWDGLDIPKINEAYNKIAPTIVFELINSELRHKIRSLMGQELPEYNIKCDEENNPPEVVISGHVFVRVSKTNQDKSISYIDVIF